MGLRCRRSWPPRCSRQSPPAPPSLRDRSRVGRHGPRSPSPHLRRTCAGPRRQRLLCPGASRPPQPVRGPARSGHISARRPVTARSCQGSAGRPATKGAGLDDTDLASGWSRTSTARWVCRHTHGVRFTAGHCSAVRTRSFRRVDDLKRDHRTKAPGLAIRCGPERRRHTACIRSGIEPRRGDHSNDLTRSGGAQSRRPRHGRSHGGAHRAGLIGADERQEDGGRPVSRSAGHRSGQRSAEGRRIIEPVAAVMWVRQSPRKRARCGQFRGCVRRRRNRW